jgi:hypothetical protein
MEFSHHLWSSYLVFMVAACRDHFVKWAAGRALYHFPNKIHLSSHDHFSYAGDGVNHFLYFVIAQTLFMYFSHQNLEDTLNVVVKKYFQFVKL